MTENEFVIRPGENHRDAGNRFQNWFFGRPDTWSVRNLRLPKTQSFYDSVTQVMKNQHIFKWDPRNPHTRPANRLMLALKSKLSREVNNRLGLYCALGTWLDIDGIDGFFLLYCQDRHHILVPFDLALTSCKKKLAKLRPGTLLITHEEIKSKGYNHISERAARIFRWKIKEAEEKKWRREWPRMRMACGYR